MATINDSSWKYLDAEYKTPTGTLSIEDLAKINNHDIASTLSYEEFDEVKDSKTTFEMWNKLKDIYGGDDNVRRVKAKIHRGQFDHMRMREDENVAKYMERIKASVSAIRAFGGEIKEQIVVSEILRTFPHIHAIRVSTIQEVRCDSNNKLGLDALVGILTTLTIMFQLTKILSLHLRPNFHSKKKGRR